jgi:probable phosphoglycerate mutase
VENWALHDEVIADWFAGRYERAFPGGEDFHEMMRRISVGLTAVLTAVQDAATTQRIVIVAHGGVLNAMARGLAQPPATPEQVARPCRNCSISEFTAALTPAGVALQLQEWSACDHLTVD